MRYRAVLFDLGGTLIEFENSDWLTLGKRGIQNAYPILKHSWPEMPDIQAFGPSFYQNLRAILDNERMDNSEFDLYQLCQMIFQRLGYPLTDGVVESFASKYYQPVTDQITLIDGADTLLAELKKNDLIIGLVSNTIFPEEFHRAELARFGLIGHLDFAIFSSSVKVRKPGKRIFDLALMKAGSAASETMFVGDRYDVDIAGAKNAGLASVLKYHSQRENPDNVAPDFSINNLEELGQIIFS